MILKNYLNIPNVKELFIRDQLSLIRELVKASLLNFPFQNITTFGKFLPLERQTPNFRQIIAASMNGEGGLCGHLNNHMKFQLEAFGYQVEIVPGCFRRTGVPLSHFLVKVKIPGSAVKDPELKPMDPRPEKTYIVDVGCGVPLQEPIDLDKLPYIGVAGGLRYKYERVDEHTVQRVNECGDAIMGKRPPSFISPQDYTIDLRPRNYSEFGPSVHAIYSNPRSVFLHQGIYCFRYLDITQDDFQIVCIRGTELIFITKETRHGQAFATYEQLKPSLFKYFPMLSPHDTELAVRHYSIPFEEALKMSSTKEHSERS